jgi:hypothetical protein
MPTDSPMRRVLDTVVDRLLLSLLVAIASVPLITGLAALTAAAKILVARDDDRPIRVQFREALAGSLRSTVVTQLLVVLGAAIGILDLYYASAVPLVLRPGVTAVAVILLMSAVVLPPFLAAHRALSPHNSSVASMRVAAVVVVGRPAASGVVFAGVALALAGCWIAPVVGPLLLGGYGVLAVSVAVRTLRALPSDKLHQPDHVLT